MLDTCQLLASMRVLDVGGSETPTGSAGSSPTSAPTCCRSRRRAEPPQRGAAPTVAGVVGRLRAEQREQAQHRCSIRPTRPTATRFAELVAERRRPGRRRGRRRCARRSGRRSPSSPSGTATSSRSRSPTSGRRARMRGWRATDAVLYAMSTALSRSGPTAGAPCCRRPGSPRRPPRCRPRGPCWSPTTTDCAPAAATTSTSRGYEAVRPVPRSAVRLGGPGGCRAEAVRRAVARAAAQSADLSDVRVPRRVRPDLSAVGPAVARHAGLARRTRAVRRPEVRDDRAPAYCASRPNSTPRSRELFAAESMDDLVTEGQRRGVPIAAVLTPGRGAGLRALPCRRRADRDPQSAPGTDAVRPGGPVRDRRPARRDRASPAPSRRRADELGWRGRVRPAGTGRRRRAGARSTGCASSTSASSSPAANWVGCSPISAPRSSRWRAPPIPTGCARPRPGSR